MVKLLHYSCSFLLLLWLSACSDSDNSTTDETIGSGTLTLTLVSAIPALINSNTPTLVFSASTAGTITYSGSCSSATINIVAGNNRIDFSALADGEYSDCSLLVTNTTGDSSTSLAIPPFIVDTSSPVLAVIAAIETPSIETTPVFIFSSTEAGSLLVSGACASSQTSVLAGTNTITLSQLADGEYNNCVISVSDAAGNTAQLAIPAFQIDSTIAESMWNQNNWNVLSWQ